MKKNNKPTPTPNDFGSVWLKGVLAAWQAILNHKLVLRAMARLSRRNL